MSIFNTLAVIVTAWLVVGALVGAGLVVASVAGFALTFAAILVGASVLGLVAL
jgi:hypothetical protein